jgi:hypothetical protein
MADAVAALAIPRRTRSLEADIRRLAETADVLIGDGTAITTQL